MMFVGVFFNTDSCPDVEEHDQRFGKQINNAGQNHKGHVVGFENIKMENTLKEGDIEEDKCQKAHDITCIHEKPHRQ